MLHGLLWLNLVLVPLRGVTPSTLWAAFGEHGGDHLLFAQLGDAILLLFLPVALLAFLFWERRYLRAVFHDFRSQLAAGQQLWNAAYHLASPVLPLAIWAACFRSTLFNDLPVWPAAIEILAVCALANGTLLMYAHLATRDLVGPAHWFDGGVVLWSAGPQFW
mmetsp:Transcript_10624/g.21571  ORF Transcript_10624/g.21571 Transcript_10624/m.21571 type:complete len:163 (-) Transcript_10624:188-676(-)